MPKKKEERTQQQPLETAAPAPKIDFQRGADFFGDYANNVQILSSNWDLRMTFGELDQSIGPNSVIQKFAVTLPWAQAKVLHYFLTVHILGHEADYGRIIIPAGIIPPLPKDRLNGVKEEVWKQLQKMYADFTAENPEAAPAK